MAAPTYDLPRPVAAPTYDLPRPGGQAQYREALAQFFRIRQRAAAP